MESPDVTCYIIIENKDNREYMNLFEKRESIVSLCLIRYMLNVNTHDILVLCIPPFSINYISTYGHVVIHINSITYLVRIIYKTYLEVIRKYVDCCKGFLSVKVYSNYILIN